MKKNVLFIGFLWLMGVNSIFATPSWINNLSIQGRWQLAQSYREAGEAYLSRGQIALGQQFLSFARSLEATLPPIALESSPIIKPSTTESSVEVPSVFHSDNDRDSFTSSMFTLFVGNEESVLSQPQEDASELPDSRRDPQNTPILSTESPLHSHHSRNLSFPDISEYTPTEQLQMTIFFDYIKGWLTEDVDKVMASLTTSMTLPLYPKGLTIHEQRLFFTDFFASYQLNTLDVTDLYDLSTLSIVQFGDDRALLTINSAKEAPQELADWAYWSNFWHSNHHLFFQRIGNDQWRLISFDMEAIVS
jgi:hypothetical protein